MALRRLRVLALLCLCAGLYAQDFRATIAGRVTDSSGSSVPNATIKATNKANNTVNNTRSGADGLYTIPLLDPGEYDIEVGATGFQTLKRTSITLEVSQRLNLPLQLSVGQVTQEMTVTGQQEIINTGDANNGRSISVENAFPLETTATRTGRRDTTGDTLAVVQVGVRTKRHFAGMAEIFQAG